MTTTPASPPLADTSDMLQIHQIFRDAISAAPELIGSATGRGQERVDLVAGYYRNVLAFLDVHHEGEDELLWPLLCRRLPDEADRIMAVAAQHDDVVDALSIAVAALETWQQSPSADTGAVAAVAIAELGGPLLAHLSDEEDYIVPLAARHIYAPEWGQLPEHGMKNFAGDNFFLILGLIREQFRPEQIAMMETHMPPQLLAAWNEVGRVQFESTIAQLRG